MASRAGVDTGEVDDFRRDLRKAQAGVQAEVDRASEEIAREVGDEAQGRARGLGSTAGHVAPSIREEGGSVELGGTAYPMAAGAEFGGRGRPTTQQFEPYRADGYFLYPAIRDTEDRAEDIYLDHIDDELRRHDL